MKMTDQKWSKILKYFALASAIIALIEGFIYFDPIELGIWPYLVSTIQNAVHTFFFDADISADDAQVFLNSGITLIARLITYLYMLVVLIAPICSTVAVYSAVELMLRKKINPFVILKREPVLILGEHESLAAAITNEDSEKYHFYYVTKGAVHDDEEELELLRKKTVIIQLDDYEDYENNVEILKSKIRMKKLKRIVIAQKTMSENLSLYMWMAQLSKEKVISEDVKVFVLCNDLGGERILEELYEADIKKPGMPELIAFDSLEISARRNITENIELPINDNSHIVITGFTPLAQHMAAQLMNRCVTSSNSKLTIDVIDPKVDDGQKAFARRFSPDYMSMEDKVWSLTGDKADGMLEIRFHKVDPTGHAYRSLISQLYQEEPFVGAIICMANVDDALSVMLEIEQVVKQNDPEANIPIGLRIDKNEYLAEKLEEHNSNLFTFDENSRNVTMDDIFYETIDKKAKVFNYIYNSIQLVDQSTSSENELIKLEDSAQLVEEAWSRMFAFQRTSSRLLADHQQVKEMLVKNEDLEALIGKNGSVMKQKNNSWVMKGNDNEFLALLEKHPELEELAKLEHRRWCYAMAINGWSFAPGQKDVIRKTNPCLVSWDKLKETRPDMCKYDLMPYMYMMLT